MKIKKLLLEITVILIAGCVFFPMSYALETNTHEELNEFIARNTFKEFSLDSQLKDQLGLAGGIEEIIDSRQVWRWLREGGEKEDIPHAWYSPKYFPYLRSINHFHNPLTDQGFGGIWGIGFLASGESSIQWSQRDKGTQSPGGHYSWHDVREYYYKALTLGNKIDREKNFADTFRGLGQLMHLVQDLSVPEHTRNDGHYLPAYENWVNRTEADGERNVRILPISGEIFVGDTQVSPLFFDSSELGNPNHLASVPIANLFDTNQYTISANPEVTLNTNIGLSEYTNANFFSPDTVFTEGFPYPAWSSVEMTDYEIADPRDRSRTVYRQYYKKVGDGDAGYRMATVGFLKSEMTIYSPGLAIGLRGYEKPAIDENIYGDYAERLVPRAVGYSAGLLEYFFRGEIDMVPDDESGFGHVIVNNTEEDTDGTFELYYDNTSDERVKIDWSERYTLGALSSGNNKSPNIIFPTQGDEKEPGKYILVFRGRLGNETDAVIGKVIHIFKPYLLVTIQSYFGLGLSHSFVWDI